jgi:predicted Ser/Thr protein kinase
MTSACPPADALLAFTAGELSDDRAAAIEAHIDGCGDCRAVLSSFARGDTPPSFGRYRIDTVLGSGGMGIVYRAWDPELGRAVAIKVLRSSHDDASGRARLVREAQSLARLSHPNVCHVYDVGSEGEEVWVAMELVDGVSLRELAIGNDGQLLDVLLGAAEGLAAAHEAGLVHRDVKPENVLVTRDGRAIVTDFGLARAQDAIDPRASTLGADPHLTATGAIAGTPAYLAPEQLGGDPIDARVDQFAWAVMAWELLTGTKPFPVLFAVRLDAIRAGVTPPPSLPAALAAVLARAMAAAPRDRFASMRELIAAVRASPRTRRKPRRTRAAAAIAFAALAAGGVAVAWQGRADAPSGPREASGSAAAAATATGSATAAATATGSAAATATATGSAAATATGAGSAAATATGNGSAAATGSAAAAVTAHRPPAPHRAPAPPRAGSAEISVAPPLPATRTAPPAYDPHYGRSRAVASMASLCHIPYDFGHPELRKGASPDFDVADWGQVTKVADEPARIADNEFTMHLIYVQGQRRTYKIHDDLGVLGVVPAKPGDLLALCPEDQSDVYQLASGPLDKAITAVTLSAPPRVGEVAALKPVHVDEMAIVYDATAAPKLRRLDPERHYLFSGYVREADGALWKMDRYWLEVPAQTRGASLVAAKKRLWFVVGNPHEIEDASGTKFVVTAAAVLDDLFP